MNTRPPPPSNAPPSYALITRVYKRSLRPVILLTSAVSAGLALLFAIDVFRDLHMDKEFLPKFGVFDIVLGSLYLGVFALEDFGIYAALSQRIRPVRLYSYLSVFSALIVIAVQLFQVVIHFVYKNQLIAECSSSTINDDVEWGGFWGSSSNEALTPSEAQNWCHNAWNRASFTDIVLLLIFGFFSLVFASLSFAYYHELIQVGTRIRDPSNQIPLDSFSGGAASYNPPPYPPPGATRDPYDADHHDEDDDGDHKLPGYTGQGYDMDHKEKSSVHRESSEFV